MPAGPRPIHTRERGNVSVVVPIVGALAISVALIGAMVAMAWGGAGQMGMMHRRGGAADQTPVVSQANQVTVEMREFQFFPANLTVNVGTEITWTNRDAFPHNAIGEGGAFDTGTINGGDAFSVVMDRPGAYSYVCTFHPGMEGTLTVR